ncbi:MAG TPA: hypothetical protein VGV18_03750 [Verrucomicrobiae bacterium]|nr:hypothetical protein [Verrucomicrobiae bacterium]
MMYVLAILIPPVYFLIKRRWMAFAFTLAALICSIFLLAELFLAPLVPVLWFACAFFAVWDIQQHVLKEKPK